MSTRVACLAACVFVVACGARDTLDALSEGAGGDGSGLGGSSDDGGGAAGAGVEVGGGPDGGAPPSLCERLTLTAPALLRVEGQVELDTAELVPPTDNPDVLCVGAHSAAGSPEPIVVTACFDAFGVWPADLGQPHVTSGATGGAAFTSGRQMGMGVLLGDFQDPSLFGSTFFPDFVPGSMPLEELHLGSHASHEAAFATRAGTTHIFGLTLVAEAYHQLSMFRHSRDGIEEIGGIACAIGGLAADATTLGGPDLVLASTSRPFMNCLLDDGVPGPATRIQLMAFDDTQPRLLFDSVHDTVIDDVEVVAFDATSVFAAWQSAGDVFVARVNTNGSILYGPALVANASVGPIALAVRGDELLIAHIDASDPDLASDVIVTAMKATGELRPLGGFDTFEAPWRGGLTLATSPDETSVVVAYSARAVDGGMAPSSVAARRFDCE